MAWCYLVLAVAAAVGVCGCVAGERGDVVPVGSDRTGTVDRTSGTVVQVGNEATHTDIVLLVGVLAAGGAGGAALTVWLVRHHVSKRVSSPLATLAAGGSRGQA